MQTVRIRTLALRWRYAVRDQTNADAALIIGARNEAGHQRGFVERNPPPV